MDKLPVGSIAWREILAGGLVFLVGSSYAQSRYDLVNAEAHRVNAYQKFIIANTYLFDHDARLSYLYAYDPTAWKGAEHTIGQEFRLLVPSGDTMPWWAEPPYHVVNLDSYTICADSEDRLNCIRDHGAYLASSKKYPEFKHEGLFVIKEAPVENPSETSDSSPQANAE
ncbi:MAG: hypothetical protein F4053_11180 [Proteobacteria bacterium]|nr:hypothetical protein [Pseudomonadota bacterium]